MKRLIGRHSDLEIVAMAESAEDAMRILEEHPVDLIFLDIHMPGITGVDMARKIPGKAMVIFTTAYSEYAVEAYEVNAIDYLVKPIDPARFDRAVEKARNYQQLLSSVTTSVDSPDERPIVSAEFLIVKADRRFVRVKFASIIYVEGLKDYVVIHLPDKKVVTRMTIKGMEELLPRKQFIRVNKSYIVNTDAIDSFDNNDIFIGDTEIAIGQSYRQQVLARLIAD